MNPPLVQHWMDITMLTLKLQEEQMCCKHLVQIFASFLQYVFPHR